MSTARATAQAKRAVALEALKAKRNGLNAPAKGDGGASSEDDDLYDEVSEQEYKSILRGRLMDDDFIEDDDGSGYVDDGRNEWERSGAEDSAEDSETEADYYERTGKKKPKKRKGGTKGEIGGDKSTSSSLTQAFARQPVQSRSGKGISATSNARKAAEDRSAAAMDAYRPKVSREKEEDFMKRLMGGLASSPLATGGSTAAPQTPSPAPALRGYPGRPSGYSLATSSTTPTYASRKRPLPLGTQYAPSVTYRTDKRQQYPSSPSEDTSAPSSDLPDPSSEGPDAPVHISSGDTSPWGNRPNDIDDAFDFGGDDYSLADAPHKKLRSNAEMTPIARGVTGQIGSLGLQGDSASRPRALRMQMGGPSDEDDDDEELAVHVPVATSTLGPVRCRMNIKAEASHLPTPITAKTAVVEANATVASQGTTALSHKNGNAAWQSIHASLNSVNSGVVESTPSGAEGQADFSTAGDGVNALNDDKSLSFYWLDHIELEAGIILLIGKVKDRTSGNFVSACLRVEGIERCVFLLIRGKKIQDGRETDEVPTEDDIYDEFDDVREKHNIKNFIAKTVERKYAFECPDVPATGKYFKVKYGFDEPALPADLNGRTFSRAFGTQTTAMELFLIKRKIMGPCWLRVTCVDTLSLTKPLSWCKAEYSIDDAKFLSPYSDAAKGNAEGAADAEATNGDDLATPREVPPLTIASIALRTVHNHQANKREIVALSIRTWHDAQLEDVRNPEERPSSVWTAVRPLAGQWPTGFEAEVRKQGNKIKAMRFERQLLNGLLAQIQRLDPDIVLTHDFAATDLDVLLARMRELKADHWSKIGRLRRPLWPKLRNGWNLGLMKGRLCCDLGSDVGKSMITSTTWSLTEMVGTHLKIQREDIDPDDVPSYFDAGAPNPRQLLTFLQHCEIDTFFQMSLAHKVQILPLTKQLTNLAGNTWARTLSGGRAERNEYILLHDFHRRKFVVPDKIASGKRAAALKAAAAAEAEAEDGAESKGNGGGSSGTSKKSKKDKFKGGLVFDPKRGLWDRYVLVMDFNSLYPSIIQEFNIDFTTVDRTRWNEVSNGDAEEDADGIPEIPSSDVSQGVLPNLIAKLVERRRQVKSLMKDKRAPAHKQLQWNVKQLALKLTANSMYGCLGFEGSRFYARPLAALTTYKGREILTATKELAESFGLDVIYGDTDSVMINTNAMTYAQAARIGNDFKKAVNEKYRLLEIDIDAVFERMLLLQKKKYAARKVEEVEVLSSGEEKKKVITEIKGLDMKRREYSALSKNVSSYVLEQILSGESTENVVASIHGYLSEVGESVRNGQIPLEDFIIFKRLGKDPKAYGTNITGQPHVHVALRMQERGQNARMGDVIPYIFCLGMDGASSSKSAQADKAHHPDELRKQDSVLKVDYEHYLALQILPPIERMCDSIQGTDRSRLAECLGLDASRYGASHTASLTSAEREFTSLDSQTPDEVRFAKCERLQIKCGRCGETNVFQGLMDGSPSSSTSTLPMLRPDGLFCPSRTCQTSDRSLPLASVAMQLEVSIRKHISRYYTSWQVCSEPSCGTRTRLLGVYAKRCLVSHCRGNVGPEYTDKALYDQLCYYNSLFDVATVSERIKGKTEEEEVLVVCKRNAEALALLAKTSRKYLDRNGRRFVDLGKVFGRGGGARRMVGA